MVAIGALFYALPKELSFGPDWLVLVLVAGLTMPAMIFHRTGNHKANQILATWGRAL